MISSLHVRYKGRAVFNETTSYEWYPFNLVLAADPQATGTTYSIDDFLLQISSPCPVGDFNEDGIIDLVDFGILAGNMNSATDGGKSAHQRGDIDLDGSVNLADFVLFRGEYSNRFYAAVPEPSGKWLLFLAMSLGLARRHVLSPLRKSSAQT